MNKSTFCIAAALFLFSGCIDTPETENYWSPENVARREAETKAAAERKEQERQTLLQNYFSSNPDLKIGIKDAMERGTIVRGMTERQVWLSIGYPYRKNTTVGAYGTHEQWVYRPKSFLDRTRYLYFENGILDSWQEID